jgi:SAM-dependent methyltransferase
MQFSQDQIFAAHEGDKWFERNQDALNGFDSETDLPLKLIELYNLSPRSVLEIGAANGCRLAVISERYKSRAVAVEPSVEAVLAGKARFPRVEFIRAVASAIPLQESVDLIIVNFVFHWIDRTNLLRSVAEIDRLLVDGGYLIIGDFCPSNPTKVVYHHLPDQKVYTYKQNYSATFLASGLYHSVCLMTGDHASKVPEGDISENDRISTWLLRKMLNEHYVDGSFCP